MTGRRIDAQQAAQRLGVKVETLYAYVSRGLIASERAPDGRTSTFDEADVERLARRGRPRRSSRGPVIDVAVETELTEIDGRHLRYRGHDAVALSTTCTFEQVAHLLWGGALPEPAPSWGPGRPLSDAPDGSSMLDRLRLAVALDGCASRPPVDVGPDGAAAFSAAGPGLIATMVDALPVRSTGPVPTLRLPGRPAQRGSVAARLAVRLAERRPGPALVAAVNAALVLLADHEMAASTLAARVAASARADAHAVVSAGLGPVAGALHGQASRAVRALLDDAVRTSPAVAVGRCADRPGPVPGVGHGLYPHGDPRAAALLEAVRATGGPARRMRQVDEVVAEIAEQGLGRPNVDLALGALGHVWSMPPDAGEAIFAVARSAGWLAHGAEEWLRRPLRFRARARYVGPR
jgi:citrate synthase